MVEEEAGKAVVEVMAAVGLAAAGGSEEASPEARRFRR